MPTSNAVPKCQYCGSSFPHQGICSTVKAFEYFPDGSIKRVEFKTAADYPQRAPSGQAMDGGVSLQGFAGLPEHLHPSSVSR